MDSNSSKIMKMLLTGLAIVVVVIAIYMFMNKKSVSSAPVSQTQAPLMDMATMNRQTEAVDVNAQAPTNQMGSTTVEHFSQDPSMMGERVSSEFPKEQLTADDLLPKDESSQWAQIYPSGEGSLKDRNFIQAGYHIGINTVGQTLRNANQQLRSEPPCPQVKVSPWLQSTIEPDLGRKPFEIGGCA